MIFKKDKQTADKRIIDTFGQHYLNGAGVATPDPCGAPPLADYNINNTCNISKSKTNV